MTASESDLTAPSAPPLAKVTEDVARTAVELAMKVAEVLQAGHQNAPEVLAEVRGAATVLKIEVLERHLKDHQDIESVF